ncbi:MAG: helicase-related protein [Acidobacteriota bacterium]
MRENATHLACTIEMLDLSQVFEVAVIDEAQMLFDRDRGWAWTTAIFGVAAHQVIITGSPSSIPILQRISEHLGESLEIKQFDRFNPLESIEQTANLSSSIEPATAIIAFSRQDVLGLKTKLEELGKNVAVIYGNLSPEVRREESRRFRLGEAEYLIATDAIGMGLNLPIKNLLFWSTQKWDGEKRRELTNEEILQIAGRAGRFGIHEKGFVGAFDRDSLRRIRSAMLNQSNQSSTNCQVMPNIKIILHISEVLRTEALSEILLFFKDQMLKDNPLLKPARMEALIFLAKQCDVNKDISLSDRFLFSCAPLDIKDELALMAWRQWLVSFKKREITTLKPLPDKYSRSDSVAETYQELEAAERLVKRLTCYAWLAYHLPGAFLDLQICDEQRAIANKFIERSLKQKGLRRICKECGRSIPALHSYQICESCYRGRWREQHFDPWNDLESEY